METIKFVVIGHVDTGKSTLCGHLLYLTGHVTEHQLKSIKQEADKDKMSKWYWARILDTDDAEKRRGKTHEQKYIQFEWGDHEYIMVDTPGHQDFVRMMIAGLNGIENVVVLVSADQKEFQSSFERGMLKEHITLARAIGLKNMIVIVNKMDLVDWSMESFKYVQKRVSKFLKQLNWKAENVTYVPVSSWTGDGLNTSQSSVGGDFSEYKGDTLLESLAGFPTVAECERAHDHEEGENANLILVKMKVLNATEPISAGFSCVCHYDGHEVDCQIQNIKNHVFLRTRDADQCLIKLSHAVKCRKNQRIVFRKDTFTIGFGNILGRKMI